MKHPYKIYENSPLWNIIKKSLKELMENQDMELTTKEEYVIGFLCREIALSGMLNYKFPLKSDNSKGSQPGASMQHGQ